MESNRTANDIRWPLIACCNAKSSPKIAFNLPSPWMGKGRGWGGGASACGALGSGRGLPPLPPAANPTVAALPATAAKARLKLLRLWQSYPHGDAPLPNGDERGYLTRRGGRVAGQLQQPSRAKLKDATVRGIVAVRGAHDNSDRR